MIRNARIQLLATALNNIGVGSILAGIVAPLVNGVAGGWGHFAAWCAGGVVFLAAAQLVLGRLRP